MGGIGSSAHLIETANGYICSRCRSGVSQNATACPHCGRNIESQPPPLFKILLSGGVVFTVGGVIAMIAFWFLGASLWDTPLTLGLGAVYLGVGLLIIAGIWGLVYPVLAFIVNASLFFLKTLCKPFVTVPKWIFNRLR